MSRLPTVGGDVDSWASVLNDFLGVGINTDGTLKNFYINASDYGVTGNGSTDDTVNMQTALAAAAGGVLYIPSGTYIIDPNFGTTGSLRPADNTTILMDPDTVLKAKANSLDFSAVIYIYGKTNVKVIGGVIHGNRDNWTGTGEHGFGIVIGNASSKIRIENMYTYDCTGDGIYIGYGLLATPNTDVWIVNCESYHNRRVGMAVINVNRLWIIGGRFHHNIGTLPESGIDIEPNANQSTKNIHIIGCTFDNNNSNGLMSTYATASNTCSNFVIRDVIAHSNVQDGFSLYNGTNVEISNCESYNNGRFGFLFNSTYINGDNLKSYGNTSYGFLINPTGDYSNITNIQSLDNGDRGVHIAADHVTLDGGIISGNTTYGIVGINSNRIKISGLKITNNTGHGIYLEDNTRPTVQNCYVEGNGTATNNTYYNINVASATTLAVVQRNIVRAGQNANKPRYNIVVQASGVSGEVAYNICDEAGVTGNVVAGSATETGTIT